MKPTIASINDVQIIRDEGLIPSLKLVNSLEGFVFNDPDMVEKTIFLGSAMRSEKGDKKYPEVYTQIKASRHFPYAYYSALGCCANKVITSRLSDDEKADLEAQKEQDKMHPAVKTALDDWKEKNKSNDKFYSTTWAITPATRFYTGKQGTIMTEASHLNHLSSEDLATIASITASMKNVNQDLSKMDKSASPWYKEKEVMTPEGWRAWERVKIETMHSEGLIDDSEYKKKIEWCETFDFHPGWNFESKVAAEKESMVDPYAKVDSLSEQAISVIEVFLNEFVLNAINKDKLLLAK